MTIRSIYRITTAIFCTAIFVLSAFAQSRPLLQDIQVVRTQPTPGTSSPTSTPLVKNTGSSAVVATQPVNAVRTKFPVLASVTIPGYSGILIETLDGSVVLESNSSSLFNPASNVKIATSYSVLKTFGPDFRFATNIYTDGSIDKTTGTLTGNIYVSGKDPIFGFEHAVSIANELNRLGIRTVTGDLIVTDNFAMNYSGSSLASAKSLLASMDAGKRSPAASRVWLNYVTNSGRAAAIQGNPSVTFTGQAYVQPIPSSLHLLFTHESATLKNIVKATMCYSNNFLAERLGDMIGGPYAVSRTVQQYAGIAPNEFSLQTASGLGYNRVTPNAMMKVLRAFREELARYKLTFTDIMPVAGLDQGTLANRFENNFYVGSVVGKTGTLSQTDAGVSALSGEINAANGKLLFVIFNQRGSVPRFREFQNMFVSLVQGQFGGPVSLGYSSVPLDQRLASSRIVYPRNASY